MKSLVESLNVELNESESFINESFETTLEELRRAIVRGGVPYQEDGWHYAAEIGLSKEDFEDWDKMSQIILDEHDKPISKATYNKLVAELKKKNLKWYYNTVADVQKDHVWTVQELIDGKINKNNLLSNHRFMM